MAMIYGLNYLGSSLVAPSWACAPGMQTGGLQGHLCPRGREELRGGGSMAGASLGGGGAMEEVRVTPMGDMGDGRERRTCTDRPPAGSTYRVEVVCPPGCTPQGGVEGRVGVESGCPGCKFWLIGCVDLGKGLNVPEPSFPPL